MNGLSADGVRGRHHELANEVISKLISSALSAEFTTPPGKGLIRFENVVGSVCKGWLNDSTIEYAYK
ncbi:hypothetical protein P3T76_009935 [Phytophthora citrophthora]|uniref:Uncharacterized protein n=1 Tax=Phytophthora citrophthora TaxID=4793 RepID=A0AAD9GEY4_9STRA|nr:hypothetical protein P3T76_009935 [Phytophthora citrophthora]